MAQAPAQMSYLETFHQPHLYIYVPIVGYWKELELVSSIKKQILGEINFRPENNALEIADRLTIINKFKSEGSTRTYITVMCGVLTFPFIEIAFGVSVLFICALVIVVYARAAFRQIADEIRINQQFIQQLQQHNPRDVDFKRIALEMT